MRGRGSGHPDIGASAPGGSPAALARFAMTPGAALSIFAAADEAPDHAAVIDGERAHTFADLARLTRARVDALHAERRDALPYPLVGANTLDTLVALYALLEMGAPALLVHPQLTAVERERLRAAALRAGPIVDPDAAVIIHTSGTSGEPRGALLTRSALTASAAASAANLGWQIDDRWLLCMPIARVGGLSIVTRSLAARRTIVLAPSFDADRFPQWLDARRVTLVSLVPTMLTRVLDAHPQWRPPAHFRAVALGGAQASARLLERAAARGIPIVVTYGMTETCSQIAATPYSARYASADWGAGVALPGIELRVRDGGVEVRGPVLMAGYWNEPPLAPGDWFDTGDVGAIDARGCLHVHARRSDLIVTGGENAYPAEVERALEASPGIAAAGVFGVPDETWGHTVAAVLVADGTPPTDAALVQYVKRHLAPHKRPRHICYVERLPLAASGKLDRGALPQFAEALRPLALP
jgi:o-succinylbenzoate---CoA ligase